MTRRSKDQTTIKVGPPHLPVDTPDQWRARFAGRATGTPCPGQAGPVYLPDIDMIRTPDGVLIDVGPLTPQRRTQAEALPHGGPPCLPGPHVHDRNGTAHPIRTQETPK